jgi:hypothetical protein
VARVRGTRFLGHIWPCPRRVSRSAVDEDGHEVGAPSADARLSDVGAGVARGWRATGAKVAARSERKTNARAVRHFVGLFFCNLRPGFPAFMAFRYRVVLLEKARGSGEFPPLPSPSGYKPSSRMSRPKRTTCRERKVHLSSFINEPRGIFPPLIPLHLPPFSFSSNPTSPAAPAPQPRRRASPHPTAQYRSPDAHPPPPQRRHTDSPIYRHCRSCTVCTPQTFMDSSLPFLSSYLPSIPLNYSRVPLKYQFVLQHCLIDAFIFERRMEIREE